MTAHRDAWMSAVLRKATESAEVKRRFFADNAARLVACAESLAAVFERGGRLFVLGNGGSACDAEHVAVEFCHPIFDKRRPLPAVSLAESSAWLTAVSNDEDFSVGFSRQLSVLARSGDAVLGITTSGQSRNVVRAMKQAREMGLLTIGLAGRDGGALVDHADHCFVVQSFSIHRIQETHETFIHVLWDLVHMVRGEEDVL